MPEVRRSPVDHAGRLPPFDLLAETRRFYMALHWGDAVDAEFPAWGAEVPEVAALIGTLEWAELAGGRRVMPEESGSVLLLTDRHGEHIYLASRSPAGVIADADPGVMTAIAYRTRKAGEEWVWRHAFQRPYPSLVVDDRGQMTIDRGQSRLRVTWRGIIR